MYVEQEYSNTETTMGTELCILAQSWVQQADPQEEISPDIQRMPVHEATQTSNLHSKQRKTWTHPETTKQMQFGMPDAHELISNPKSFTHIDIQSKKTLHNTAKCAVISNSM